MEFNKITQKPIIQYCLVSEQPSPNLSPIYDERIRPSEVVLVVSPEQKASGRSHNLENIIKPQGIKVHILEITDAWDKDAILEQIDDDLEKRANNEVSVFLNATGGTKPMSLAAYEVFYNKDHPVFYVNNDRLSWLFKPKELKSQLSSFNLQDKMKLKPFFASHGVELISTQSDQIPIAWQEIGDNWVKRASSQAGALSHLNAIASQMQDKKTLSYTMQDKDLSHDKLQHLLDELQRADIAVVKGSNLKFKDENCHFFANGGWLECWVMKELNAAKKEHPRIQDIKMGAKINYVEGKDKTRVKNELDVVVLANNRLHIIECKTSRLNQSSASLQETKATDSVYKLATIMRNVGGIQAKGIVTSFHTVNKTDKERAGMLNIRICDGGSIKNIKSVLLEMIG